MSFLIKIYEIFLTFPIKIKARSNRRITPAMKHIKPVINNPIPISNHFFNMVKIYFSIFNAFWGVFTFIIV